MRKSETLDLFIFVLFIILLNFIDKLEEDKYIQIMHVCQDYILFKMYMHMYFYILLIVKLFFILKFHIYLVNASMFIQRYYTYVIIAFYSIVLINHLACSFSTVNIF